MKYGEKDPVTITRQPEGLSLIYGTGGELSVEAETTGEASCQWYKGNGTKIENASGTVYDVPGDLAVGTYTYYCEITCENMTVRSNSVTVNVEPRELSFIFSGNTRKIYDGTADVTGLSISPANKLENDDLSVNAASYTYDSADAGENKIITANNITLAGSDKDNYKLSNTPVTTSGVIEAKNIADGVITLTEGNLIYDGAEKTQGVAGVTVDGLTLSADDYTITGNTGINAGSYTMTVTGNGNFTGTVTQDWSIGKASLENAAVTAAGSFTYDGTGKTPAITVKLGDAEVNSNEYIVSYSNTNGGGGNHTNAGTVTVTVTAKADGNYYGSKTTEFKILPKEVTADVKAENKSYDGTTDATVTALVSADQLAGNDRITISNVTGSFTDADAGTNKTVNVDAAKAVVTGAENYRITYPATVTADISKASAPNITYPTAGNLTYGQSLSESTLSGGSTEYGSFAWADGTTVPNGGTSENTVVFTPSDNTLKNYEEISGTTQSVSVSVKKAVPTVSMSESISGSSGNRQAELTVTVEKAGNGAVPTGTVQFLNVTDNVYEEVALTEGKASCTWTGLENKSYTVKVIYSGDGNYENNTFKTSFDTNKKEQTPPPAFEMIFTLNDDGETYTAVIPAVENGLYSFDGVNYSASNTKTDCDPVTEYTGYVKYKETETYNESAPTKDTQVTPRLRVKAPVITPNGDSFGNDESVEVEITCGTTDAVIYYTTDGSDPSAGSMTYEGSFTLDSSAVVRAIAVKSDWDNSDETAEIFVKAASCTGIYDGAEHGITVTPVEGTVIRYGTAEGTYDKESLTYTDAGTYTVYYQVTRENCTAVTGSETVTIKERQITVSGISVEDKVYDKTDTATLVYDGVVYDGLVEGDTLSVSAEGKFADVNVGEDVSVNISGITLGGPDAGNYILADDGQQETAAAGISAKNITVSITPNGGTYEGTITAAAAVANDVIEGDQVSVTLTYSGAANDGTNAEGTNPPTLAGIYTVTAAIDNSNYKLTGDISAQFVVDRADPVLSISPVEKKTYGDEDFTIDYRKTTGESSVSFSSNDESVATVDENGTVHIVGAGSTAIVVNMAQSDNYNAASKVVTVNVAPKPVTVTAGEQNKIYGEKDPILTYTADGLVTGDILTGELARTAGENAGTYDITQGTLTSENNPNYSINFAGAALTIEKADQTIPSLAANNETIRGKADGTIDGLTTAMEYRTDDADNYTPVDNEKMNFAAGTWKVRYAADENHNASQDADVTIEAGRMLKVTFMTDDKEYAVKEVEWDATLTDIPAVPAKEGFDETAPRWDTTDFTHIREDRIVTAVYIANGPVETEPETKVPETEPETKSTEIETEPETKSTEIETESETKSTEIETEPETKSTEIETEPETKSTEIGTEPETKSTESETKVTESETKKSEAKDDAKTQIPTTDDNTNLWLWIVIMLASCGGMIGSVVYVRRRKESD